MVVLTLWTLLLVLVALAALASIVSLKLGISVAIVEILLGAIAGNTFGLSSSGQDWFPFLATLGGVVLTFLAGAEIDHAALQRHWKASFSIGAASFLAPFLAAAAVSRFFLGWSEPASLLTGVALSTTSVAVVYVVLVETGRSRSETGKLILAACFITDLGTAIALSLLFVRPNALILLLFVAIVVGSLAMPTASRWIFAWMEGSTSEPEVRFLLLILVLLGALATWAGSFAVLPAYVLGLSMAPVLDLRRDVLLRFRSVAFILLTPFFFLLAGTYIDAAAVLAGAGLIVLLFGVKVGAKFVGVGPLSRLFVPSRAVYVTLLMSTGLTFGTIASLYGLSSGIIDRSQFSVILTTVLATAIIPTLIAQRWFQPA
jgi:Kef-type K+ transport system membrane component KefB